MESYVPCLFSAVTQVPLLRTDHVQPEVQGAQCIHFEDLGALVSL